MWSLALIIANDEVLLYNCLSLVCKIFINKLIYMHAFTLLTIKNVQNINENIINYTWEHDHEFKNQIQGYLIPYYELIVGLFLTIFPFNKAEVHKFLQLHNKDEIY